MWSFLQKNSKEKNRLLGIVLALSGVAHGSLCLFFLLAGRFISSQRVVVCALHKTVRVSMRSGGAFPLAKAVPAKAALQGPLPSTVPMQKAQQDTKPALETVATQKTNTVSVPEKEAALAKKSATSKENSPPTRVTPPVAKKNVQPKKPISAPVVQKEPELFSRFVRPPRKKEVVQKSSSSEVAASKPEEAVASKKEVPGEEVPLCSSYTRKQKGPSKESSKEPSNAPVAAVVQPPTQELVSSLEQPAVAGSPKGSAVEEQVSVALEDAALSDHAIVREVWRHFRKPPGFDEHEPFVFTFEIKHKKVIAIGPRGNEPLIIYTAIKDAVLKATFEDSLGSKRVELLIT